MNSEQPIFSASEVYWMDRNKELEEEQARLQARIKELVEQLRRAGGRCEKCGYYLRGHATGGADILHLPMNDWLYVGKKVSHRDTSDRWRRRGEVIDVLPYGEFIVKWEEIKRPERMLRYDLRDGS